MLLLYEKCWGPKEATCFAMTYWMLWNFKKWARAGLEIHFFLERLKAVNFYYSDQKKVTGHKGHLQTYKLWSIKDQTAHASPVSYGDTVGK